MKVRLYDQYLGQQVKADALKFLEWNKLSKKIGKNIPIGGSSRSGDTEIKMADYDWKLVSCAAENWFDPKLEFCETFYSSPVTDLPDVSSQHAVVMHVAAFLNTAGGIVLIGFATRGQLKGLFDDDMRTNHHYKNRIETTLKKTLGKKALKNIYVQVLR